MRMLFIGTGWPSLSSVGVQYALVSPGALQVFGAANSFAVVVKASTLGPKKVCRCEAPGIPGRTIGSSGPSLATVQSVWTSGTRVVPAVTGFALMASKAASSLAHLTWSTGTKPPAGAVAGLAEGVQAGTAAEGAAHGEAGRPAAGPNVTQLRFTKSDGDALFMTAKTVCAPVG